MKYKVGDNVKIRKDLKVGKVYGHLQVSPKMRDLGGKIARITEVNVKGEAYKIDLAYRFYWTDEMFEDVDKGINKHVVIAEKPYSWLEVGVGYYVPKITYKKLYEGYVYTATSFDEMAMERGIVFKTKEEAIACAKKILEVVKWEGVTMAEKMTEREQFYYGKGYAQGKNDFVEEIMKGIYEIDDCLYDDDYASGYNTAISKVIDVVNKVAES